VGYLCQYLIKPMLGFVIAKARLYSVPALPQGSGYFEQHFGLFCGASSRGGHRRDRTVRADCTQVLNLSPALATGLILVSCCPGGQASYCH
jgi:hypothetical protein